MFDYAASETPDAGLADLSLEFRHVHYGDLQSLPSLEPLLGQFLRLGQLLWRQFCRDAIAAFVAASRDQRSSNEFQAGRIWSLEVRWARALGANSRPPE